jgi:hypothetical protein
MLAHVVSGSFRSLEGMEITDMALPQTVANIRLVYRRAGYTFNKCGEACGINPDDIIKAITLDNKYRIPLSDNDWETMKRVCNKRVFDHESIVEG